MQHKPKISVIIPVYKTERYLEECVDSVLIQTFKDLEIILVNDGSPDNCGEICERIKKKDNRIHVLHQNNQGVTKARANGIAIAKGEWICFVDSDDTLPQFALEHLASVTNYPTDIIIGSIYEQTGSPQNMSIEEYRKNCITAELINPAPFPKLFHRNLFKSSFIFDIPRSIIKGEDMLMNIRLAFMTNKDVYLIHQKVYNYRVHEESCMKRFRPTTEYERSYQIERKKSIPQKEYKTYQKYCIQNQLQALKQILKYNYNKDWKSSVFVKELIKEIKATQYQLNWKDWLILKLNLGWILKVKR